MKIYIDTNTTAGYQTFLRVKSLPSYRFCGHIAEFPDEYIDDVIQAATSSRYHQNGYVPPGWMYDYQRDITRIAIRKRKYCVFADCGLGKTAIMLEFAKHAKLSTKGRVLITSPLMVIPQTISEAHCFYGEYDYSIEQVHAADLQQWMNESRPAIGITNYEAIRPELTRGNLSGLILDESSMLKSHYGKWGTKLISMGRGLDWKLCCTGTPAPNDRIEYANHAVFMDAFPNVNSFLARYFVNRGQTQERWALKPHALKPFYRALSHWCIFLSNPATYGWKDNTETIPPIKIHTHEVPLTEEQKQLAFGGTGRLFADRIGGITSRSVLSQIAKGNYRGKPIETHKPRFIRELIESWPSESTLIWCRFNAEQDRLAKEMPDAGNISGDTPHEKRQAIVDSFKRGDLKTLISKPKILGFGLNLQVATRQVFSALDDSYEEFYQAVKRSNRIGSTRPLNVHLPLTDIEQIQAENVLRKMRMVQADTEAQEEIFRDSRVDIT